MNSLIRQFGRVSRRSLSIGGLTLLMLLEGFSALPYKDIAGIWTDGYGNTHGVRPGVAVTQPQAQATLQAHVDSFGAAVLAALTVPPTQGQFDAYLLLAYNIGPAAFRSSAVVKAHNKGDPFGACLYLMRWNKVTLPDGRKVVSRGLVNRRWAEYNVCLSGIPNVGYVPRRN